MKPSVLRVAAVCAAAVVVAGGSVLAFGDSDTRPAGAAAELATARRGDVVAAVSAAGSTVAGSTRNLAFSAPGTVRDVYVRPGDTVTAGDVLALAAS